jgi:hypothetical protein
MKLPAATAAQACLRGPADGQTFLADDLEGEEIALVPPLRFVAAVHHGALCCGEAYEAAEDHGDGPCDCMPPTRGLYLLDMAESLRDGSRWVYIFEREVLSNDPSNG